MRQKSPLLSAETGATMMEVLVTIVIVAFGLLGLAGLQTRLQVAEVEAYQRSQALILLNDMANRLETNRSNIATYVTGADNPVGSGMDCPTAAEDDNRKESDFIDWCNALQGASTLSGGARAGAVIGGRGCVESLGSGEYLVTVTWQGLTPLSAPPASVACGKDLYDGDEGSTCTGDLCRRAVTTIVRIATLG